jgi:hypothetical protein
MHEYEGGTVVYVTTVEISSKEKNGSEEKCSSNLKIVASASFSLVLDPCNQAVLSSYRVK